MQAIHLLMFSTSPHIQPVRWTELDDFLEEHPDALGDLTKVSRDGDGFDCLSTLNKRFGDTWFTPYASRFRGVYYDSFGPLREFAAAALFGRNPELAWVRGFSGGTVMFAHFADHYFPAAGKYFGQHVGDGVFALYLEKSHYWWQVKLAPRYYFDYPNVKTLSPIDVGGYFENVIKEALYRWDAERVFDAMLLDYWHREKFIGGSIDNWVFFLGEEHSLFFWPGDDGVPTVWVYRVDGAKLERAAYRPGEGIGEFSVVGEVPPGARPWWDGYAYTDGRSVLWKKFSGDWYLFDGRESRAVSGEFAELFVAGIDVEAL